MEKPLIGLTPLYDTEQERFWMRPNYMQVVMAAGGIPLVFPMTDDKADVGKLAHLCDGFLFTGGPDVHPSLYHEETLRYCGAINQKRDALEMQLLKEVSLLNKPVLGICRGIQLINVALGGSLYQDIPAQVQGVPIAHSQEKPYNVPVHSVELERESPLFHIINKETILVNSMHHQAIKGLASSLKCAATSADGIVEGVYMPEKKFFLAVQWHPEFLWQENQDQRKIISMFVDAARS